MIETFKILILLFLVSCAPTEKKSNSKHQVKPNFIDVLEANHDTLPNGKRLLDNLDSAMSMYYKEVVGSDTLKGGYITCYGIDDSTKYLYLRHRDKLHLLNQTSIYTSTWSLGTLENDFETFFTTRIDHGNGVPETFQIFDKKSGENILGDNVEAWNFKYLGDTLFFLYDNRTVNLIGSHIDRKEADSIFVYNVKSGKRQGFKLAKENTDVIIYYDIKNLTKNGLTISRRGHFMDDETYVKYSR